LAVSRILDHGARTISQHRHDGTSCLLRDNLGYSVPIRLPGSGRCERRRHQKSSARSVGRQRLRWVVATHSIP